VALADELEPDGPEVALVGDASTRSGDREGLARTGASPYGSVIWPPGAAEGVAPDSDSGEGVELRCVSNVIRRHLGNAAFIDSAGGDVANGLKVSEPLGRERFEFVVEGAQATLRAARAFGFSNTRK
jgi:hypothetical protein